MKTNLFFILSNIIIYFFFQASYAGSISNTYNTGEILTAGNLTEIATEVSDNDARIVALENPSATTGRIFIPTLIAGNGYFTLDEAGTYTSKTVTFARPSDYTPGGSNDVTIRAYVSGCSGSDAYVALNRVGYNVGSNSTLFLLPSYFTLSIRAGALYTFYMEEAVTTTTGFSDLNQVTFMRNPAASLDTCTGDLLLRLIVVEYPKDPSL